MSPEAAGQRCGGLGSEGGLVGAFASSLTRLQAQASVPREASFLQSK